MRIHVINIGLSMLLLLLSPMTMAMPTIATTDAALIKKLDLDGDGEIGIKEAVANPSLLAEFGKIDTDCSGTLSVTELAYYARLVASQAQAQQVSY
jgi:hypothetical protein